MQVKIARIEVSGRQLWAVTLHWDSDVSVVRYGESLGGALTKLGTAVGQLEQAEKQQAKEPIAS